MISYNGFVLAFNARYESYQAMKANTTPLYDIMFVLVASS